LLGHVQHPALVQTSTDTAVVAMDAVIAAHRACTDHCAILEEPAAATVGSSSML
jgi:hypothetical protein